MAGNGFLKKYTEREMDRILSRYVRVAVTLSVTICWGEFGFSQLPELIQHDHPISSGVTSSFKTNKLVTSDGVKRLQTPLSSQEISYQVSENAKLTPPADLQAAAVTPNGNAPSADSASEQKDEFAGKKATEKIASNDVEAESDEDYTSREEYDSAKQDEVARKQEYGQQRTDSTRAFLRTQTPLLKRGQWQFDLGATYSISEVRFPALLPGPILTEDRYQLRDLDSLLGFRYGVNERLQWFGATRVGWQSTEVTDGLNLLRNDTGGIGDLVTGFNFLLRQETECAPSIITSFTMTAPTGNPRNPVILADTGLGLGAWTFTPEVLMVKSLDPVVLFWGAGYRHVLENNFQGDDIKIGDSIQYNFGTGFGVNENVTLSSALLGSYILDTKVNSQRLLGTAGDAISIRTAATIARRRKIIEPFVTFGLTQRAPAASLGIIWTR